MSVVYIVVSTCDFENFHYWCQWQSQWQHPPSWCACCGTSCGDAERSHTGGVRTAVVTGRQVPGQRSQWQSPMRVARSDSSGEQLSASPYILTASGGCQGNLAPVCSVSLTRMLCFPCLSICVTLCWVTLCWVSLWVSGIKKKWPLSWFLLPTSLGLKLRTS